MLVMVTVERYKFEYDVRLNASLPFPVLGERKCLGQVQFLELSRSPYHCVSQWTDMPHAR